MLVIYPLMLIKFQMVRIIISTFADDISVDNIAIDADNISTDDNNISSKDDDISTDAENILQEHNADFY